MAEARPDLPLSYQTVTISNRDPEGRATHQAPGALVAKSCHPARATLFGCPPSVGHHACAHLSMRARKRWLRKMVEKNHPKMDEYMHICT
jgi:hypothetical protein